MSQLFDVYSLWNIEPIKAKGSRLWDKEGKEYLDLYGGHAVVSIGHSHPHYINKIQQQVENIAFYSNSVLNSLQTELAEKLGEQSGYPDYPLFLCNSGAEAVENALKLASFHTGKKRIISFSNSFHGRTSGAVAATDIPSIQAPFNQDHNITFVPFNDIKTVSHQLQQGDVAGVIIEGIQGIGGIYEPDPQFLQQLELLCKQHGALLILDEIQSGYGRTGRFFAHQHAGIRPDIITIAKGMGNGFPIGGVLISPLIQARKGLLGTTFGGNHLACAAAIAVLDVMKEENLTENAKQLGQYLISELHKIKEVAEVRGRGLMVGIEFTPGNEEVRNNLLFQDHIFTGMAQNNIMRLLPPLSISKKELDHFLQKLQQQLSQN